MSFTDALSDAAFETITAQAAPYVAAFIVGVRQRLLEAATPQQPPMLRDELASVGLNLNDEQLATIWGAITRSIAATPRGNVVPIAAARS